MKKIIILGNPPSDNHLYGMRVWGKRVIKYITPRGKAYKRLVKLSVPSGIKITDKEVFLDIKVFFGDRRKRDIQGHLKALIDALQGVVYVDDSQVVAIQAIKFYDKDMPRTTVEIYKIDGGRI